MRVSGPRQPRRRRWPALLRGRGAYAPPRRAVRRGGSVPVRSLVLQSGSGPPTASEPCVRGRCSGAQQPADHPLVGVGSSLTRRDITYSGLLRTRSRVLSAYRSASFTRSQRSRGGNRSEARTSLSGVAALEQVGGDRQGQHGPDAQDAEPLPGGQQVTGLLLGVRDQRPGLLGQVGVDVRAPAARQQPGQDRQHEHDADDRGDGARGVPDHGADREREQPEHGEVQPGADDGAGDARAAQRHRDVGVQDGRADEERAEGDDLGHDDQESGEHHRLGGQHRYPARDGQERGADHPGRVLAGDDQHAQDADGELPQSDARAEDEADRVGDGPGVPLCGPRAVPVRLGQPGDQRGEADAQHDEDDQRPDRGAHRADLRPLGLQQVGESGVAPGGRAGRPAGRGDGRRGRHRALPRAGVHRILAGRAEFHAAGRQFHERAFQRGQRGQLVQHDGRGRGEFADPGGLQAGDREQPGALGRGAPDHFAARRRDQFGQPVRVGGAHPDRLVGAARDHVLGAGLGDELAPADDDQVVGGDGHLVHQVAGHQDGSALGGEPLHQVPDPQDAFGVEPVDRLVEEQDLRVAEHGHGDAEPLAHAEREAAGPLVRHVLQADQVQHLLDPAGRQTLGLGQEQQVVAGRAAGVHGLGLEQRSDGPQRIPQVTVAPAVDERGAGVRPVQAQDEAHGGGLAGAVRPEEPRHPAWLDREGQVVHRRLGPVELGQIANLDHAARLRP